METSMTPAPVVAATVPSEFELNTWSGERLEQVEQALSRWVTADAPHGVDHGAPAQLVEAMRYAVLDGGKRLRPLLVLAAHEAVCQGDVVGVWLLCRSGL